MALEPRDARHHHARRLEVSLGQSDQAAGRGSAGRDAGWTIGHIAAAGAHREVFVIGGGFSGIGVAISLDKAGIHDYEILEAGDSFGGTWHWNRYPGIAVDIPSFSYQYSFEKRTNWSRVYAPGAELRAYSDHCARKYGLY